MWKAKKYYVFNNHGSGIGYGSKRFKEKTVYAETILEAKQKMKEMGCGDLKFERIGIVYDRIR